jgi:hypothetical protein
VGPPEDKATGADGQEQVSGAAPDSGGATAGSEALPDLRDEPSLEDVPVTAGAAHGEAQATTTGAAGASGAGQPGSQTAGGSANGAAGTGQPGGSGPLTPAEQVAILDAQLAKGAGEFDAMILKTEAEQRAAAREQAARSATVIASGTGESGTGEGSVGEEGNPEDGNSPYADGVADAGGYSSGGGGGGMRGGGGSGPQDTTKYPPPADIPSGNDDDVVARQLREAAEREPDPAVRAKLWDEYRKYKGIEQ